MVPLPRAVKAKMVRGGSEKRDYRHPGSVSDNGWLSEMEKGTLALRPGWRSFHGIGLYTRAGGIWRNCRHGLRAGFEERRGSRCIVQYHRLQTGSANDAHEPLYPGLVPWYQYASWGRHRRSTQVFNCTSSKGAEYKCKRIKPMPETATRGPEALKKPNSQMGIKRTSS